MSRTETTSRAFSILALVVAGGCGPDEERTAMMPGAGIVTVTASAGATDGDDPDDPGDDDDGILDAGSEETTGEGACIDGVGPGCPGCDSVDLLFIVDNSQSMEDEQIALGQAFPNFADTIIEALPPGVNLHVGVTSTEMGFAPYAQTINCTGTGSNTNTPPNATDPAENWYYGFTPDEVDTGTNGAQGRLYVADGLPYFDINTDAPESAVDELKDWFRAAAHIGEGGSNIEMATAAAAWAMDADANPGNAGFIRDDGSVLVLFFVQDEPDQTPLAEQGVLLEKVAAAKQQCGGWDCVVGGGFVNELCMPQTPLGGLLGSTSEPATTATLPPNFVTPETFDPVLSGTLAQAIVEKCNAITPQG